MPFDAFAQLQCLLPLCIPRLLSSLSCLGLPASHAPRWHLLSAVYSPAVRPRLCCATALRCRRAAASVALSGSLMELPPEEFQQLMKLAAEGSGQIVLRLAGESYLQSGVPTWAAAAAAAVGSFVHRLAPLCICLLFEVRSSMHAPESIFFCFWR